MWRMSSSLRMPCITEPAQRNRSALKNPWVRTWKMPAAYPAPPMPTAATM